nr:MAG TPA: hypothetical protein [Caudoviricetes sp.]
MRHHVSNSRYGSTWQHLVRSLQEGFLLQCMALLK